MVHQQTTSLKQTACLTVSTSELAAAGEGMIATELIGDKLYAMSVSYSEITDLDNDRDEYHYHNAATCPDCGQGMIQLGDNLTCPGCGFSNCGI